MKVRRTTKVHSASIDQPNPGDIVTTTSRYTDTGRYGLSSSANEYNYQYLATLTIDGVTLWLLRSLKHSGISLLDPEEFLTPREHYKADIEVLHYTGAKVDIELTA